MEIIKIFYLMSFSRPNRSEKKYSTKKQESFKSFINWERVSWVQIAVGAQRVELEKR
eukprot:TRINITY_DN1466_c1_g1_i1.p1 TRINITY_DN1466_c1_g1~~TRINITY_DN1466_c1_g1_i1.p1  ORF type:complete len:57 (-),score=3.58 TRINITY_DN1466_c1_g1_i1:212-382(-)